MNMSIKKISLYFKEGSSDKEYHTQLEEVEGGFVVNFQYGRRGSTLTTGTKTKTPVLFEKAEKAYNSLVKEKLAKGYTEGESGAIFQSKTLEERITGIVPQLLNTIEEEDLQKYFSDDSWMMQEKFDGCRLMIKKVADEFTAINKKGLSILIPQIVEDLIRCVPQDIILDGEIIGDKYYIFDILEFDGRNLRSLGAKERYDILCGITPIKKHVVDSFFDEASKQEKFAKLKEQSKEGVVFKRVDSSYVSGRPASGGNQLKFKFWASATVEVIGHHKTKRSVFVAVYNNNEKIEIGKVSIPSNYNIPNIGDLVEVIYLYCHVGGAIYQSKYKGVRHDQDLSDCSYSQLKFKASNDDDDEVDD